MQKYIQILKKIVLWAIIVGILALVVFYFAQDFMTFPGRGLYASNPGEWQTRVGSLGYQGFTPADFLGAGGSTVRGIWAPCGPTPGPAILWLHSREQTTTEINQNIKPLTRAGLHVFAMEFRGYGASTGETTEANLLSDGEASIEWMSRHEGIAGKRVFVGGLGFGANIALKLASRNPVHGVVAVNPLPDMATAIAAQIPFVPLGFLLKENFELGPALAAVSSPVFIVHGTDDRVVSMQRIEEIVAKLAVSVRVREVPGAGHLDALERGGNDLSDEIAYFKDRPR